MARVRVEPIVRLDKEPRDGSLTVVNCKRPAAKTPQHHSHNTEIHQDFRICAPRTDLLYQMVAATITSFDQPSSSSFN